MNLVKITTGLFWVEIPNKDFYLMCGCPMDSIKHLTNKEIIKRIPNPDHYIESGPNTILLSDLSVQNGYFCNLAEFPILHMMYKQGMSLPGHPGNKGQKPRIIGTEEQVTAQKNYIFRGNYGLASLDEFQCSGCNTEFAEQLWQLKLKFNYNIILEPEELIDTTIIGSSPVELKSGVFLERQGLNLYRLSCGKESVDIDLNLKEEECYEAPYKLAHKKISLEHFSVIHVGEGNGWDNNRPCMGSVLTYKGKIYLIDAGPNIEYSLNTLGISVNDVEGIFHTHIHDDHFAGLTYLVMADHKIKYYATPVVMETARKKLSALVGQEESMFDEVFDTLPLECEIWNDLDGLEIKPLFSPHPVETSIFYFRVFDGDGYKSYGHLADIVAAKVLKTFISDDPKVGISQEWFDEIWKGYLEKASLKKIDVGGGFVHGEADDFRDDPSDKLLLSHTDRPLTREEKKIGISTSFGSQDVLIPARQDYKIQQTRNILKDYFPDANDPELDSLLNNSDVRYITGNILFKKGEQLDSIYLILSGKVDYIYGNKKLPFEMTAGSMIGITNSIWGKPTVGKYKASSHVDLLKIPIKVMKTFLKKNGWLETLKETNQIVQNLRSSFLFGSRISSRNLTKLAQQVGIIHLRKGDSIPHGWSRDLYFINKGSVEILRNGKVKGCLHRGETLGGFPVFPKWKELDITARVTGDESVELYRFSYEILKQIPVVQWKLYQIWCCWTASC